MGDASAEEETQWIKEERASKHEFLFWRRRAKSYFIATALRAAAVGFHGRGSEKINKRGRCLERQQERPLTRPDCNSSASSHNAHLTRRGRAGVNNKSQRPAGGGGGAGQNAARLTAKQTRGHELFTAAPR